MKKAKSEASARRESTSNADKEASIGKGKGRQESTGKGAAAAAARASTPGGNGPGGQGRSTSSKSATLKKGQTKKSALKQPKTEDEAAAVLQSGVRMRKDKSEASERRREAKHNTTTGLPSAQRTDKCAAAAHGGHSAEQISASVSVPSSCAPEAAPISLAATCGCAPNAACEATLSGSPHDAAQVANLQG